MRIFVINLQRSSERRKYIQTHLKKKGLEFEIIEGVDGRTLSKEDFNKKCDINIIKQEPVWLNRGAIGCALSHLQIYQRMVSEGIESALIMEDDLVLPDKIKIIIEEIEPKIKESELILLFYASSKPCPFSNQDVVNLTQGSLVYPVNVIQPASAAAYCISLKAAEGLAKSILPVRVTADSWDYYYKKGAFNSLRCFYPMQLRVMHFKSVIEYLDPNSISGRFSNWVDKNKIPGFFQLLKWQRRKTIGEKTSQFYLTNKKSPLAF